MTRFFVKHPVTTWMIFAMFVVLGAYAVPRLQIEAIPDVDLPQLSVYTRWNGASPQAIQRSITVPVEEAVRNVHGVEKVESRSRDGMSTVTVSFRRDVNLDFARLDVNEQLGNVRRNLPLGANQPQIQSFVPEEFRTEDFFTFSMESELGPNELREMAETWVVPQLTGIEGVADASVIGGARPLLKIVLDRRKLDLYGIRADEVFRYIDRLDEFTGAGAVRERGLEKLVALREPINPRRIEKAVVARRGGRTFTLDMLGEVRADFEDPVYFVRANGNNVVQVAVGKRSGANTVGVSQELRRALPGIEQNVPFQVTFHIDEDQGKELEDKLRDLVIRSFAILGILFILLVATLRQLRLTVVITASILFAIVISLSLFYFLGISVNFITISGLTVCFGLILDNSILVLDSIHRRLDALKKADERHLSRRSKIRVVVQAIHEASGEVLFPILATTLTTIVAFASFIFLSGRLALYYVPLAIAVATALFASLFVAFGWVPMVLDRWWAEPMVRKSEDGPNELEDPTELTDFVEEDAAVDRPKHWLERAFEIRPRLVWAMIPLCLGMFYFAWWAYDTKVIKGGFWSFPDQEELFLYLEMPSGTDIELTSQTLFSFESELMPVLPGMRMVARTFGNQAIIRVEYEDSLTATPTPMYHRSLLIEKADATGGSSVFIRGFSDRPYFKGAFGGSALNSLIKISGYNSKRLMEISEETLARAQKSRRVRNARITTGSQFERIRQEEMVVNIQRDKLATHNLTVDELVGQVRRLLGVDIPWSMLIEGEQERVQLSYMDADDISYADINEMVIRNSVGEQVRLGDLITLEKRDVSRSITRENQKYTAHVNWEYLGTDAMRQRYIRDILAGIQLPYGYEAEEARREFFTDDEEGELNLTVWLALAFIFFVLAALFESVSLPLLVLMSVPMALVGVSLTFWLTHSTFDSSARIGLILLFGIVVNNAILLVSRFRVEASLILKNKLGGDPSERAALIPGLRKQLGGSDLYQLPWAERGILLGRAVSRGTRIRLRSILLTSGTTIVGLAPLLFHVNETADKDIWENLALASIGGLASSTVLLIMVLPPLYYYCVRFGWLMRSWPVPGACGPGGPAPRFLWLRSKLRRKARTTAEVPAPEPA
jgi:HAE1 family hydrophobic/amphiphilic exporter-1